MTVRAPCGSSKEVTKAISQLMWAAENVSPISLFGLLKNVVLFSNLSYPYLSEVNTIVEFIAPAEHRTKSGVFILSPVLQILLVRSFLLVNRNDSGFSNSRNSPVFLPLPNRFSPKTPYCAYCGRRLGNNNKLRFLW